MNIHRVVFAPLVAACALVGALAWCGVALAGCGGVPSSPSGPRDPKPPENIDL
jgi:hypothetical protein